MDLHRPGTERTPERFLKAIYDATSGYEGDHSALTAFPTECEGPGCRLSQIIDGPISFYALCEHHSLRFHGFAHVSYIAGERIIGISKVTRLVRLFARRFTVQERLGREIADALVAVMDPLGVAADLEAVHLCTQMRGVREGHSPAPSRRSGGARSTTTRRSGTRSCARSRRATRGSADRSDRGR